MEKEDVADSLISKLYKWWQSRITSRQYRIACRLIHTGALHSSSLILVQDTAWRNRPYTTHAFLKAALKPYTHSAVCDSICSLIPLMFTHLKGVFSYTLPPSLLLSSLVDTHQFLTSVISRLEAFYDIKTRWTYAKPEKLTMQDNKSMQKHRYVE